MTTLPHFPPTAQTKSLDRPPASPLLTYWTTHPRAIDDAIQDSAEDVNHARKLRADLDAVARGQLVPDVPALRVTWAVLGMSGAFGLLDKQRQWHRDFGGRLPHRRMGGGR